MRKLILILCLSPLLCFAQVKTPGSTIKVFLDCQGWGLCDFDYVRTEIKFVDFVRDRFVADVHVLINAQRSSSGGRQATLNFIGQKNFAAINDTLSYFNDPTATDDEIRKRLVHYLNLGLIPFAAKTDIVDRLSIKFDEAGGQPATTQPEQDPWNYWIFQLGAHGSFNGQKNYKSSFYYLNVSADRETENWKINFDASINNDVQTVIDNNDVESRFQQRNYNSSLEVARSISEHWSYGLSSSYTNSLFSNIRTGLQFLPKVEYSFFPYSKFNTQRVVLQYRIGPIWNEYYDTTVFFKTQEWQLRQNLNLIGSFTKPWGSINAGIFYANYFDDFSKNNLSVNGAVSWRVLKGLNFAVWGNYGIIHDQINLRKGNISRDDLLVKNKELKTTFRYNLGVGFSYRFGSVMNSIVNPRFRGLNYSINF